MVMKSSGLGIEGTTRENLLSFASFLQGLFTAATTAAQKLVKVVIGISSYHLQDVRVNNPFDALLGFKCAALGEVSSP